MGQPRIRYRALAMFQFHTPDIGHIFIPSVVLKVATAALLADAGLPHATRGSSGPRRGQNSKAIENPSGHGVPSNARNERGFDLSAARHAGPGKRA